MQCAKESLVESCCRLPRFFAAGIAKLAEYKPPNTHMLARLIYRMLTFGHEYADRGIEFYETKYRQQQLQWVTKQAAALRMQLVPLTTTPLSVR